MVLTLRDSFHKPLVRMQLLYRSQWRKIYRNIFIHTLFLQSLYSEFQKDCPSGYLTPQKFTELYARVSNSNQADEFRARAFSQFDKRANGTINFRDFLMVVHVTSNGSAEDKLRTMFTLYDQDGNGSIDATEMNK